LAEGQMFTIWRCHGEKAVESRWRAPLPSPFLLKAVPCDEITSTRLLWAWRRPSFRPRLSISPWSFWHLLKKRANRSQL
jgi:hypothetical protein